MQQYCKWCTERASGRGAGRVWVHMRRAEGGRATFDSRSAAPLGAAALTAAASASPCSSARAARAKTGLRAMSMKLTCITMPRDFSTPCHHLCCLQQGALVNTQTLHDWVWVSVYQQSDSQATSSGAPRRLRTRSPLRQTAERRRTAWATTARAKDSPEPGTPFAPSSSLPPPQGEPDGVSISAATRAGKGVRSARTRCSRREPTLGPQGAVRPGGAKCLHSREQHGWGQLT